MADASRQSRVARRLRAAERYLEDSAILNRTLAKASDAAYQIELLAFEILLKATVLAYADAPKQTHQYDKLFGSLPEPVRSRIVERAANRMGCHADYADVPGLLRRFGRNFVKLRYDFEEYDHLDDDEYDRIGRQWLAEGAPLESATFVYHAMELSGLVDALRSELEDWMQQQGER